MSNRFSLKFRVLDSLLCDRVILSETHKRYGTKHLERGCYYEIAVACTSLPFRLPFFTTYLCNILLGEFHIGKAPKFGTCTWLTFNNVEFLFTCSFLFSLNFQMIEKYKKNNLPRDCLGEMWKDCANCIAPINVTHASIDECTSCTLPVQIPCTRGTDGHLTLGIFLKWELYPVPRAKRLNGISTSATELGGGSAMPAHVTT